MPSQPRSDLYRRASCPQSSSSLLCDCGSCSFLSKSVPQPTAALPKGSTPLGTPTRSGARYAAPEFSTAFNPGYLEDEAPSQAKGGLILAAAAVARVAILVAVLFALVAVRTTGGVIAGSAFTLAAVFGVYVAFGKRQGMSELLVYLLGFALFAQARAFGDDTGVPHLFTYVIRTDSLAGVLPSAWLQQHFYTPGSNGPLVLATSSVYVSYFMVVHIFGLYLWMRRRELFGLYAGTMLLTFYSGLLVSFIVPTAPPWLAAQHGDTAGVHRVFQEMVNGLQSNAYAAGSTAVGQNDVAAMPSLHMAVTFAIALFAWKLDRRLGIAGGVYAFAMGFSLVFLGEHYVTDVLAGAVFAAGAWSVALRVWQPRTQEQRGYTEEPAPASVSTAEPAAAA